MMKEELHLMKYLKIDNNKAFFIKENNAQQQVWLPIDEIGKEDLLALLNSAIANDFEMDEYNEDLLGNKAHQIIYKNLHDKFTDLLNNKTRFKEESEGLYKAAFAKYGVAD